MGFIFYLIYNLFSPLIFFLYIPFIFFSKKTNFFFTSLKERFFIKDLNIKENSIYFHASSIGEVKAIKEIILNLKEKNKDFFITTSTLIGKNEALKYTENVSLLPFDFYPIIKKFIKKIKPEKLILVETEIWPNLIYLSSKKIPVFFINARISDKSFTKYKLIRPLLSFIFKNVNKIITQSKEDEKKFSYFTLPEKVINIGNIKYDNRNELIINEELKQKINLIKEKNKKVLIFASTHKEEEIIIIKTIKLLKEENKDLIYIIAPRHLNRIKETYSLFEENNLSFSIWSSFIFNNDIIIIDEMGILNSLYTISDISFVGGTLNNIGGHNILEPAFYSPVLFGPNFKNAKLAGQTLLNFKGGFIIKDEYDFKSRIKFLLSDEKYLKRAKENAKKALLSLQGSTNKIIKIIFE